MLDKTKSQTRYCSCQIRDGRISSKIISNNIWQCFFFLYIFCNVIINILYGVFVKSEELDIHFQIKIPYSMSKRRGERKFRYDFSSLSHTQKFFLALFSPSIGLLKMLNLEPFASTLVLFQFFFGAFLSSFFTPLLLLLCRFYIFRLTVWNLERRNKVFCYEQKIYIRTTTKEPHTMCLQSINGFYRK